MLDRKEGDIKYGGGKVSNMIFVPYKGSVRTEELLWRKVSERKFYKTKVVDRYD